MSIDINAIRKKLNQLQTNVKRSTNIWKPQPGKSIIRIIPSAINPDDPFIELLFHYNIAKKPLLSLATFGESDPIVEFATQLKESGDKEDWLMGNKLEPKLRTFVPIIIRGKEKDGIKFWGFGKTIYKELLAFIADADYGDITDIETGRDITLEFTSAEEAGNDYGNMSVRIKPNVSPATTDSDLLDSILNNQPDIYEIYKRSTYDELKAALAKWLNPENNEQQDTEVGEEIPEAEQEIPEPVEQVKKVVQPVATQKVNAVTTPKPQVTPAAKPATTKTKDVSKAFSELFDDEKK